MIQSSFCNQFFTCEAPNFVKNCIPIYDMLCWKSSAPERLTGSPNTGFLPSNLMFESQLMQMPCPRDIVIYRHGPLACPVVQKPRGLGGGW